MTDITELAQREKFEAWFVNDVAGADVTFPAFEDGAYAVGEIYDEQLYFMLQAMWMAWKAAGAELVEALEKAQQERENWRTSFDNERFRADKLKAYIDDMEPIRAAAEKLVRCKGRYHSEQNYRALAALFGVNTPDLPPLEHENVHYADAAEMEIAALRQRIVGLEESNAQVIQSRDHYKRMTEEGLKQLAESRAVTVKLPQAVSAGGQGYQEQVERILTAAGIKVEAE
ncbi:hypothetical protein WIB57_07265 [Klebsiella pneumoniae]